MSGPNLSEWALNHRAFTLFLMIVVTAAGLSSYFGLGRNEDPAFTFRTMVVQAAWPGATLDDTLQQVTERLERKLQDAGVEKVVPDGEVLAKAYRRQRRIAKLQKLLEKAMAEPDDDAPIPDDLAEQIRGRIGRNILISIAGSELTSAEFVSLNSIWPVLSRFSISAAAQDTFFTSHSSSAIQESGSTWIGCRCSGKSRGCSMCAVSFSKFSRFVPSPTSYKNSISLPLS